jgi:predicted enzyme related to lactoylglutathione lyase
MLNLNSIMIGTMQTKVMADFYKEVFGKPAEMEEGGFYGWSVGSTFFTVGEHSEMGGAAKDPGRIMFNFETTEVKEEFDRIMKIPGAKEVKAPYEMGEEGNMAWIATIADPDGNYFQLMTPWEPSK